MLCYSWVVLLQINNYYYYPIDLETKRQNGLKNSRLIAQIQKYSVHYPLKPVNDFYMYT